MSKKILQILSILLLCTSLAYGQAPQQFNYQGAARNANGTPLANRNINLRLSILDGSATGTSQYSETRSVLTNTLGLYHVIIGSSGASSTSGNLSAVTWNNGLKYIKVEIDPNNGNSFATAGTAQLLSVPYAIHASTSGSGAPGASAYQVWIDAGNTGTITDYLNSIKGAPGATGPAGATGSSGKSAFEVWKEIPGNETKTTTDYTAAIKGDTGATGATGADGGISTITNTIATGNKIADITTAGSTSTTVTINESVTSLTDVVTQVTDEFGNFKDIHTLTFHDEKGDAHPINLELLIKGAETLTSLNYDQTTHRLIYTAENGAEVAFNLVDLVGPAQTITSLNVDQLTNTLDHKNENNTINKIDLTPLIREPWFSTATNTGAISNTDNIYTQGWVGIGYTSPSSTPNEKLRVNGAISAVNGYYADYVFEDYFKGESSLKSDYKFKSLDEVNAFIKRFNHLPGITPITELTKTKEGYAFNISELSIQLLEKVEELYLHVIEQKNQMEAKDQELKDLRKRLERLEAMVLKQ